MDTADKTISTWTHKVSFWLTFLLPIFLICFSVPLLSGSLNAIKSSVLVFATAIIFICFLIDKINRNDLDIRISAGSLAMVLLCSITIFASLGSGAPMISLFGNAIEEPSALTLISIILFGFLFAEYQKNNLNKFAIVFLGFYILSSVFSVILFVMPDIFSVEKGFNLFGSLSSFAVVSAIMLPLSILFFENEERRNLKIFFTLGIILPFFVLIFLNSKLAFIFSAILLAFIFFRNVIYSRNKKFPLISFVVLTSIVFFIFGRPIIGDFFPKLINLQSSEVTPDFKSSLFVLGEELKESTLLGAGPARFLDSWTKYQPVKVVQSVFWNSRFYSGQNSLFYFGVTLGAVGLLCVIGILFYSLFLFFKNLKADEEINNEIKQLFFLTSILSLLFFSLNVGLLILGFLSVFLILNSYDKNFIFETSSAFKKRISLTILSFGFFISVAFLVLGSFKFAAIVFAEKAERVILLSGDLSSAQSFVDKSIKIFPNSIALKNDLFLKRQKVFEAVKNSSLDIQPFVTESIFSAKRLINYDSNSYYSWNDVGAYFSELARLNIENARDEARTAFLQSQILSPVNPTPEFMLGRLSLIVGDTEKAKMHFNNSIQIKSNYVEPHVYLGILEEKNGNNSIAESYYQKAVMLNATQRSLVNLGNFYLRSRDLNNAKESFVRAVALSSNINQNYLTLVMIYSSLGENGKATDLLSIMMRKYPEDPVLQSTMQKINVGESFENVLFGKEVLIP